MEERIDIREDSYRYWLYAIDGIGKKAIGILNESIGQPEDIYKASEKQLTALLTQKQVQVFKKAKAERDPLRMYEALIKNNIRFIPREATAFPQKLREIPDAPYALYVKGKLPDSQNPSVAIIGARLCSEYGRYMARIFGQDLGGRGFQIVSGMAMGIDGIAEKAAFQAGGTSFSVLGCGVDICYPAENRDLYELCIAQGGLISEYPPGTAPKPGLFPPRNRIISGLADAVLVIEARAKSGTLITVDMALEQGREVYVLPGRVTDRLSDGCNSLLKQGALIATCAADIAESFYRPVSQKDKGEEQAIGKIKVTAKEAVQVRVKETAKEAVQVRAKETAKETVQVTAKETAKETVQVTAKETAEGEMDFGSFDATDPGMVSAVILYVLDVTPKTIGDIEAALARKDIRIPPSQLMCTLVDLELCGRVYREGGSYSLRY